VTTQELIAAVRARIDEQADVSLIPTALILEQASLAQTEFARSTLALYDVSTATIAANDRWLALPSNLFVLKTVIFNGKQLRPISASELDFGYYSLANSSSLTSENTNRFGAWRETAGTPKFVVNDMHASQVRFVPYPSVSGEVSIEGYIVPPDLFFEESGANPELTVNPQIPEVYHEVLLAGALLRLFMLLDIDVYNQGKAQLYNAQWIQGIQDAQNNLRTSLRRQIRIMDLPMGFAYDSSVVQLNGTQPTKVAQ
jgi:hypothetical protein